MLCRIVSALLVATAAITWTTSHALAATHVVTNTDDSGPGSLRQAVLDAAPVDLIQFASALWGQEIDLESQIVIDKSLEIEGPDAADPSVTINAHNKTRIFRIEQPDPEKPVAILVRLSGLRLVAGKPPYGGGGCVSIGSETAVGIHYSSLRSCRAAGSPSLGGAIANWGYLSVRRTTISLSQADLGGAIYSRGQFYISDSSFEQNTATKDGGAIHLWPENNSTNRLLGNLFSGNGGPTLAERGGAIYMSSGTLSVGNTTMTGNLANEGAAIYAGAGQLDIRFSTIVGNQSFLHGGAVNAKIPTGNFTVENSILWGNFGSDCSANMDSLGGNVVENCVAALSTDLVGSDPKLLPLAWNGGPTDTHALPPTSVAIDRVGPCIYPEDQRGFFRYHFGGCDPGAFELESDGVTPLAIDDFIAFSGMFLTQVSAPGVLVNDIDPGGLALTAELVSAPAYGNVNLNPDGSFEYFSTNLIGDIDSFTYRVSNGMAYSSPATVTLDRVTGDEIGLPCKLLELHIELPWSGLIDEPVVWDGVDLFYGKTLGMGRLRTASARSGVETLVIDFGAGRSQTALELTIDRRRGISVSSADQVGVRGTGTVADSCNTRTIGSRF